MAAGLAVSLLTLPVLRGAAAQSVTVATSGGPSSLDPHYQNVALNIQVSAHFYDRLVGMDERSRLVPGLAESWRPISDRVWEFKLRHTRFHDGSAFTAEDVAYTLTRLPTVNSPSSFRTYTNAIKNVEIVDAHTVRIETGSVYPLLPTDLAGVFILPHGLGPQPAIEDFNSGKFVNGTGPYRLISYKPGDRLLMERNDAYWGPKPAFSQVVLRIIGNGATRVAALLSGDVAMIDSVPPSDIAGLSQNKAVKLWQATSLRMIYLMLEQSRDGPEPEVSGPNGEALSVNPLRDLRVRRALSIAVNRDAIVSQVMEGVAIPTGQFLPPGSFSYVPDFPPPAFDAARAKALLAEAGYPNGFRITLHSPKDRYPNDAKVAQAVGQMWTRVGVQTSVQADPIAVIDSHINKQDYPAALLGWSTASGEASNSLRALVATYDIGLGRGTANRSRYSNPSLDAMITKASSTADDAARELLLQQATKMAMDDVALVPLYHQKNTWATRSGLRYRASANDSTYVFSLSADE
eukprot:gene1342-1359_t